MADKHQLTKVVEWSEEVRERIDLQPPHKGFTSRPVASRRMRGTVEIVVNLEHIARVMGRKALTNKTGKSVDGPVTVKRVYKPEEISRTPLDKSDVPL